MTSNIGERVCLNMSIDNNYPNLPFILGFIGLICIAIGLFFGIIALFSWIFDF